MKKLLIQSPLFALAGLLVVFSATADESFSVLLQKGIHAEETEGNLDAAITIYEEIVKEADANRALVAQAQYRLGVSQLKKGKQDEAETAFRRIISQFADQAETLAKARERLSEMGKSVSSVVVRQIWSGPETTGDSISRNGRHLAFIDWNSGNLAVRDLTTDQTRRLTNQGSWESPVAFAETCAISPDGQLIA
ncbi:MAG: tetratricopeptide repeat protein [Verrucomicrobia bacterium]|nr:tetratricopeptide repeat protein [Verrucomicrobiota bacterium]